MSAFFCPAESVYLKAHETRTVQLHFLPFNLGNHFMSVTYAVYAYILPCFISLWQISANPILIWCRSHTGKYSCSVILMNEKIGEFLYTVEVQAVYPQVSTWPFKPGPHSVRISSAAAASMCFFSSIDDAVKDKQWMVLCAKPLTANYTFHVICYY